MIERIARLLSGAALAATGALFAAPLADAQPPADASSIWTLQDENASITTNRLTDRYYVNGLRLGWTSPTDLVPDFASRVGRVLWGDGRQRISIDLSQEIYTPADTQAKPPDPHDRPYAGVLTGDFSLLQDNADWRSLLGLQLGVVGPGAGGEEIQNGWHDLIGQGHALGWNYQIHNEPVIELLSQRIYRVPIASFGGLETDTLPDLEVGVGNLRVYALTGTIVRLGQGLGSDFGPARVRPGLTGADAYTPTRPFAWYIFAGFDGQAVAHDITLDGNTFESSAHVSRQPFVGEAEAGLAVMFAGLRVSYTHVVQTQEFHGQHGGLHQFGSLAISARF
ncbi:MAG: lipid A deacylase LpxR family protein [Acidisphaera sp.]|nr:lipid A deacylase LpxR family protein [Acidisphaera sp.]